MVTIPIVSADDLSAHSQEVSLVNGESVTAAGGGPVASFTVNATSGYAPLTVRFNDTSTGSTVVSWNWTFGDGTVYNTTSLTNHNVTKTYYNQNTYLARLTVSNPLGSSSTIPGTEIFVLNPPITLTGVTPSSGVNTGPVLVNITGTNIYSGVTFNLTRTGQSDIPATNVIYFSSTKVNCSFPISGKSPGLYNLTAKTPCGMTLSSLANAFTITPTTSPVSRIGFFQSPNIWKLDTTGNGAFGTGDQTYTYGASGDKPVSGDWNKNGTTKIGVFRSSTRQWFLDMSGNGIFGPGDVTYSFGATGDKPVTGDWNKNGTTKIGVFRSSTRQWFLDWSGNGAFGTGDVTYTFGATGDTPVTGGWSGTGQTRIGVFRPSTRQWFLDWSGNGVYGPGDVTYTYGASGDIPVTGDWSGNGRTKIGVYRPTTNQWFLDWTGNGVFGSGDVTFTYGASLGNPVVGGWTQTAGSVSVESVDLAETMKAVPTIPVPPVSMPVNAIPRVSMPVKSAPASPVMPGGLSSNGNPLVAGGGVQIPGTP